MAVESCLLVIIQTLRPPLRHNSTATLVIGVGSTIVGEMISNVENRKLAVLQEMLDQLFSESLIPFELNASAVNEGNLGEFHVFLSDDRFRWFQFSWKDGDSFKEVVRIAVLTCEDRIGSQLPPWVM